MANKQKIRIKVKAYDHKILDEVAKKIIQTKQRSAHADLTFKVCLWQEKVKPSRKVHTHI